MKKVKLVQINSEVGAGTRGASLGVDAMKIASLNAKSDYFNRFPKTSIATRNETLFESLGSAPAKNVADVLTVIDNLTNGLSDVLTAGDFPIVLAGDHSSAAGTIAGIKKAHPDKRLGVIWVDAHADLHSPYTSPSGNMHGMPLAMSLAEDNLDQKRTDLSEQVKSQWEELKNISGQNPAIQYEDLVLIGVRDTEAQEDYLIDKHKIKSISVSEVRVNGMEHTLSETLGHLDQCDLIYVSFDVDSMDCCYVSHGTGTPVKVGFTEEEVTDLLKGLLASDKLCCFEVTEVNPLLDEKGNVMAETAFRILEQCTEVILAR